MPKTGWQIGLDDRGRERSFIVGLSDADAAQARAMAECENATVLYRTEISEENFDKLGLVEGCLIESGISDADRT